MSWTVQRKRALGAAVAALCAIALLAGSALVSNPATAAPIEDHRFATYNMQGSNKGQKWTDNVKRLIQQFDVVALQEAGGFPQHMDHYDTLNDQGLRVEHYGWQAESANSENGGLRNVYYMQTDRGGNQQNAGRVNLAIVTRQPADQVFVVPRARTFTNAAGQVVNRPGFGVRFGQTIFFTMHGMAGNGNDDASLLGNMAYIAQNATPGGYEWVVGGDFNRDPARWNRTGTVNPDPALPDLPQGARIYASNRATHMGDATNSELDYMVASRDLPADWGGYLPYGLSADHAPVGLGPRPANDRGRERAVVNPANRLRLTVDGRNIIVHPNPNNVGARVSGVHANGTSAQRWSLRSSGRNANGSEHYQVVAEETGQCMYQDDTKLGVYYNPNGQVFTKPCSFVGGLANWNRYPSKVYPGYFSLVNDKTGNALKMDDDGRVTAHSSLAGTSGTDKHLLWTTQIPPAPTDDDTGPGAAPAPPTTEPSPPSVGTPAPGASAGPGAGPSAPSGPNATNPNVGDGG